MPFWRDIGVAPKYPLVVPADLSRDGTASVTAIKRITQIALPWERWISPDWNSDSWVRIPRWFWDIGTSNGRRVTLEVSLAWCGSGFRKAGELFTITPAKSRKAWFL